MLFNFIKPMDAIMGTEAFDDDRYLADIKFDGWRLQLHKDGNRVEAYTKQGNVITDKFPEVREWANQIKSNQAVLDCEVVCFREDGRTSFDDIQYRGRISKPEKIAFAHKSHPATLIPFDLLYTSKNHVSEKLIDRKYRLQELILPSENIIPTLFVEDKGKALHSLTQERNLEGCLYKKKNSTYKHHRSSDWIKIKNFQVADTVILAYEFNPFRIIVGMNFPTAKNKPVAKVEFGFKPKEIQNFLLLARELHTKKSGKVQWIHPSLCCRIQYLDRTDNHHLRITSFKGFLFDKEPDACTWSA